MPDDHLLDGKICLVTGATAGLGKAAALGLAKQGATVILVGRDRAKTESVANDIKTQSGNNHIEWLIVDISSLASVRQVAEEFKRKYDKLHVLINNAGVYKSSRVLSPDGLEMMFATNYLGHFLLTNLLLDTLKSSAPSTILNVAAPSTTKLNFDDLQGERKFSALHAFGASKMCDLLFTFTLARRLQTSGVSVNAYHPGIVKSNLMQEAAGPMRLLTILLNLTAVSPEKAADGLVYLASTNAEGKNGKSGQLFHGQKTMSASVYAQDEQVQERLWAESARLVKLKESS